MNSLGMMTPKQRFMNGILGMEVDITPIGSVTSVVNYEQMEISGVFFPEAHLDGEKMARLASLSYDILEFDGIMPNFSVQAEAGALDCDVDWGDAYNMPKSTKKIWQIPKDVRIPSNFLERVSIKTVLEAIRILKKIYGNHVAIIGKVMGPWTLGYHTHGVQDFLIKTILEPKTVRQFLNRLKDITLLFGMAQIDAGIDALCIADHASGDLVSPQTYRDFLLPIHQELSERIGHPTILHICGNTYDRLDYICSSGFNAFHFESIVDASMAVKKVNKRISLIGNINNPLVLLGGSPADVIKSTCASIDAGVNIVGPECAIPLQTPLKNLLAIRYASRRNM